MTRTTKFIPETTASSSDQPESDARLAPDGLTSLHRVALRVRDLDRSTAFYRGLTRTEPTLCVRGAIFRLNGFTLHLVGPTWPEATLKAPPALKDTPLVASALGGKRTEPTPRGRSGWPWSGPQPQAPKHPGADWEPAGGMRAGAGSFRLSFEVSDLPGVYRRMRHSGVCFDGPWIELAEPDQEANLCRGTRVAHFCGPDGESLELVEPAGPFVRSPESPDPARGLDDAEPRVAEWLPDAGAGPGHAAAEGSVDDGTR